MTRRGLRVGLAGCVALAVVGFAPSPAGGHGGEQLAEPILEHVAPAVAGVKIEVAHSVNYQFVARNDSGRTITFLAETGEEYLRIGPGGVEGNLASPAFYDSNDPQGATQFPERAKPGPDVPPIWRRIAAEPAWGWYDHRLHPADPVLTPEVVRANKPAVVGRWAVPIRLGDQPGEVAGRFEYRPLTGTYTMVQKSPVNPADGVRIQVVPASRVPAVFVENLASEPVVVLGRDDEPFARIGPTVSEVNVKSPTWVEVQQARGQEPSDEADAGAEPKWQQVADSPRWTWLEFRAAAPHTDPPRAIVESDRATTVRTWSIPYLVGQERRTIDGITEFVPLAVARERAGRGPGSGSGDGSDLPLYGGVALAAAVLGGGGWLVTSNLRNRSPKKK
ncbi:MAG TPA: hypothetical protein VFS16_13565 [Acidimicrobiia bacterium]|nr:hypothetical protein [Acidimicrobiia bacterium]